jgi:sugar-specific transcriptional regulator TrmB
MVTWEMPMATLIKESKGSSTLYDESARLLNFSRGNDEHLSSLKMIKGVLAKFGLSNNEIRVYVYLARSGARKARDVSDVLSLHRTETYKILRSLEKRGLVSSVFEKPLKFIATSFEKTIDILIKARKLRIEFLERKKKDIVDSWLSLPQLEMEPERKEVFQVLEGKEQFNLKADEILEKTRKEICIFAPDSDLLRLYHSGFTDRLEKFSKSRNIKILLLTNNTQKSCFVVGKMKLANVKHMPSNIDDLPGFIIADHEHLLFSIKGDRDPEILESGKKRTRVTAFWTNYEAFINALKTLFFKLWKTETPSDVQEIQIVEPRNQVTPSEFY